MVRTGVVLAAVLAAGCGLGEPQKDDVKPQKKEEGRPTAREPKADVEGVHHVAGLWDVCAGDAVRWQDAFAGRHVVLMLSPPWEIRQAGGRFYTVQEYQNGARPTAARIYLEDESARRFSRIIQGEEKIPAGFVPRVRALVDEKEFVFEGGVLSVVKER